jgi:hypothetical protein
VHEPHESSPLKYRLYLLLEKELRLLQLLAQLAAQRAGREQLTPVARLCGALRRERQRLSELL